MPPGDTGALVKPLANGLHPTTDTAAKPAPETTVGAMRHLHQKIRSQEENISHLGAPECLVHSPKLTKTDTWRKMVVVGGLGLAAWLWCWRL